MLSEYFLTEAHRFETDLEYSYNYWLVALSYVVAVFAAHTSFQVVERIIAAPSRIARLNWLVTGAVAMGCGIWSMHFVAMLSVEMHQEMRYDALLTILSAVFAILAAGFAFDYVGKGKRQVMRLVLSGTVLGVGIGLMHYTGMLAMQMNAAIRYNPLLFGVSIIVAATLSTLALRLMFFSIETKQGAKQVRLLATAAVMGMAIATMHYTGMAATHFLKIQSAQAELHGIALYGPQVGTVIGGAAILILGLAWLGANIDQRMRNKDAELQQSQNTLQAIVDTALDGILTFDEQSIVKTFNPAAAKIFGFSPEEVLQQHLSMLIPAFEMANQDNKSAELKPGGKRTSLNQRQMEGKRKDGSTRILEMSLSEMWVNHRLMYTAIVRDVTTREQAAEALRVNQAELRASQERLKTIMNSVGDAVISIDAKGIINSFNASAERIFGYSRAEALDSNVSILMPEPESSQHDNYLSRFQETGKGNFIGRRREVNGKRKDGTIFPLEIAVTCMEPDGLPMFVGVCTDITNQREIENQLRQSQKMDAIGQLAGGIAHDLNNVLVPVMGLTQLTIMQLPAESQACSNLEKVVVASNRAKQLVDQILTFSRTDAPQRAPVCLPDILEEVLQLLRAILPSTIEIRENINRNTDPVLADSTQIHQVLMNLTSNAKHAMEESGGILDIILEPVDLNDDLAAKIADLEPGLYSRITVSDTGVGMEAKTIERIFDPFFTTKAVGEGTGMGLSVAHGIVAKHEGAITVSSAPGQGTTFELYLPHMSKEALASDDLQSDDQGTTKADKEVQNGRPSAP